MGYQRESLPAATRVRETEGAIEASDLFLRLTSMRLVNEQSDPNQDRRSAAGFLNRATHYAVHYAEQV